MPLFVLVSLLRCPKPVWWHIPCMTFIFPPRNLMGTSFCLQYSEISWCYVERGTVFIYCTGHSVDSFGLEINTLEFWKISWNICFISSYVLPLFSLSKNIIIQPSDFPEQSSSFLLSFPLSFALLFGICILLSSNSSIEIFIFLLWAGSVRQNCLGKKKLRSFLDRWQCSRKLAQSLLTR